MPEPAPVTRAVRPAKDSMVTAWPKATESGDIVLEDEE